MTVKRNFIISDPDHAYRAATMIIKSHGLNALKPKFFKVSVNNDEEAERQLGSQNKDLSQFGLPVLMP